VECRDLGPASNGLQLIINTFALQYLKSKNLSQDEAIDMLRTDHSTETDVYVWRYLLSAVHARNEE